MKIVRELTNFFYAELGPYTLEYTSKWSLHDSRWAKRSYWYDGYVEYGSHQRVSGQLTVF